MDEVIIEKQEYLLFDKYKLNTNRNITRYEYISNVPLKVSKREPDMRVCKCGAHLITLAYIFDNNIFRSRTLLGRKCPCCGHNYFTLKTIALCEEAFTIVEYTDLEENIGKEVQVDMYEVKRGDIYFADLTGIEHHCGSEQTGWRPVMIVQNDVGNYYSTTTIIATITSKIKGSQPTHVYLESGILDKDSIVSNVDEVIRKRVLAKNETATQTLRLLYEQKESIIKNLITFTADTADKKLYADKADFADCYPFIPYQFNLLGQVLTAVRTHGASGKHLSDQSRSMLALFQESAIRVTK